ncbi:MAG: hypothetical protein U5K38_00345 [Woeseiaceae bacterium]|nr:hypothetical protein [Woeseiaceae bacterium]
MPADLAEQVPFRTVAAAPAWRSLSLSGCLIAAIRPDTAGATHVAGGAAAKYAEYTSLPASTAGRCYL